MADDLDRAAIEDTLTIEDVKQFVTDAKRKREDYLNIANRSWDEIDKKNKKGRLYGGNNLDRQRRWTKFPLWWSCWKIRQPLTLARLPLPVIKDTQGDDPYGRTACVVGERLTRNILKTFDALVEFQSSNDDLLVTNFGWGRWCYRKDESYEEEKIRLQMVQQEPQVGPDGAPMEAPPLFFTPDGQVIPEPLFDDMGPYVMSGQTVEIDNEEVYFESQLYSNIYVDPDARRWNKVTRLGFEYQYSYREFIQKFGRSALDKLEIGDIREHQNGKPIIVIEYHDKFLKEVRWFAENSTDFFQPEELAQVDENLLQQVTETDDEGEAEVETEEVDNSDLYGLSGFFPCTAPLIMNQSTREFWPTPEYFQVADIIDDIHNIVGRMFLLTKAIRIRFFFDSSVTQLQSLIGETGEGGGLGIPNLEQNLMAGGGKLSNLVAYLPVDEMVKGLNNMYVAFDQRLNMFYNITGISDLIRGQTNPDSDKTFGERQMEGKFALNRIEPYQRAVQEWIKDNYQLGMEMALKMFSEKSLDAYITPQTLDPEDKERYTAALELLKNNKKRRFRIDFETDSTIQINETWRKSKAIEMANVLTKALESTANIAETQPELAATELSVLKHLIGEFSDGKLFVDEIQDSIEQVISKVSQPKEPEFNEKQAQLQFDSQKLSIDDRFRNIQLQTQTQIEFAKLEQKSRQDAINSQLAQFKLQIEQGADQAQLQLSFDKLAAEIQLAQQEIELKKAELLQFAQAEGGKSEMEAFKLIIDERVKNKQISLQEAQQQLEAYRVQMEAKNVQVGLQERIDTERRLQQEAGMKQEAHVVDTLIKVADTVAQSQQQPQQPKAAPVTIDKSTTINVKQPEVSYKKKPKGKK